MQLTAHTIEFCRAVPEDAAAILSLIHQLEHFIPEEIFLQNLQRVLNDQKDYHLFVARENKQVVAYAEIHFLHFVYEEKSRARLTSFCVEAACRGQKIGSGFLHFLEGFCKEQAVYRIELTSNLRRHDAHRFYEKNGYTFVSKAFHKNL